MEINFEPNIDLEITLAFDSPHVVFYDAWFKKPNDSLFTKFASGKDQQDITVSKHSFIVKGLPNGSKLIFELIFSGNPNTSYKGSIILTQHRKRLSKIPAITGTTNNKGVDGATIYIDLVTS